MVLETENLNHQPLNPFWSKLKPAKHVVKIVSEYDQEIPQSQTADNPVAPRGNPLSTCLHVVSV